MQAHDHWTEDRWRELARGDAGVFMEAAVMRSFSGDVPAMTALVQMLGQGGHDWPTSRQCQGMRVEAPLRQVDGRVLPTRLDAMTLMACVAAAVADDPADRPVVQGVQPSTALTVHAEDGVARGQWTAEDACLVRAAVRLWRDDARALNQLMVYGAGFVVHEGFVQAFIDEGMDVALLLDAASEVTFASARTGARANALVTMVYNGNAAGAARWLDGLDERALQHPQVQALFDALLVLDHPVGPSANFRPMEAAVAQLLHQHLPSEARLQTQSGVRGMAGLMATGTIGLLGQACRINPSRPDSWLITANALQQYLLAMEQYAQPVSHDFVDALLAHRPREGKSLHDKLASLGDRWPLAPEGSAAKAQLVSGLLRRAAASHCAGVLEAATGLLQAHPAVHAELAKAVAMGAKHSAKTSRAAPLDEPAFRRSLRALKSFGIDIAGPFEDAWRRTPGRSSLLHALAESGHPDTCAALLVALEEGCDATLRNGRDRLPSACLGNRARKQQWLQVERAFLARRSAHAALEQHLGQGFGASA